MPALGLSLRFAWVIDLGRDRLMEVGNAPERNPEGNKQLDGSVRGHSRNFSADQQEASPSQPGTCWKIPCALWCQLVAYDIAVMGVALVPKQQMAFPTP